MSRIFLITLIALLGLSSNAYGGFYKEKQLFSQAPDEKVSVNHITRVGPIGVSLDLVKPAFTMKIKRVEAGSPAEQAGLKPGQIIASINGQTLADIDPRIQLGNLITAAEAKDGLLKMAVADKPGGKTREVTVRLETLGSYSETWPLDCPKSDKIVRNFAEYLKTPGSNQGFGSLGMLFLLSTGDASDLAYVKKWARSRPAKKISGFHTWNAGYGNLALCEYYLRTGDQEVMPAIQAVVDNVVEAENNGAWGNRGAISNLDYGGGGGHLNASSVVAATFLLLAKECGAEMPDETLLRVTRHFYRFAGRGNIPYGNNKPEGSYTDNGKNGAFAFTMAAAANLTPNGEASIYAKARDISALFSFPSTSFMLHGHTGGGIGEIWRSAAMGLLYDKQPHLYREFMDQRRWHYEMSRRFDGSFAILGGERYDNEEWGAGYAWTYTVPRKTLRLTGAPPTEYSKSFKLPERPWGTAEDDDFVTTDPIAFPDGKRPDFSKDTLATGGGIALLDARKNTSKEDLQRYMRHPVIITRNYFKGNIAKQGPEFILQMLEDEDARMRRLALDTIVDRGGNKKLATPQVVDRAMQLIADPQESWFVKEAALRLVALAPEDTIVEHVDVLVPYLNHDEWWLQHSAMEALGPVVTDPRVYKTVLPALGKAMRHNHLQALTGPLYWGTMGKNLRAANPEVAQYAREVLKETYTTYVAYEHPMPNVEDKINAGMSEFMAKSLVKLPGGYDALYEIAKKKNPGKALPYPDLFLEADPSKLSPELKAEVDKIVETRLIPAFIGKNRSLLMQEMRNEAIPWGFYYRRPRVLDLVDLYHQIDVHDYDWNDFGTPAEKMAWSYHTFDPPEKMAWDINKPRYREVTLPEGMDDWYKPEFDPERKGWETGLQPFGASNGKLHTKASNCGYDFCRHGLPMKTLWDKEVLLLHGTFKFPEFEQGHRYRLVVGGMSHVGAGEGFKIYVNGKEFFERERGVGKREGAKPISKHIDRAWWDEFSGKEVRLAQISFMASHKGWKNRHLMIWVQEMKLPPVDETRLVESATIVPMTSSDWQALQDPDNNDLDPSEGKYRWDGQFVENPAIRGDWETIAQVDRQEDFDPQRPRNAGRAPIKNITFKPDGKTDDPLMIWTGSKLLNLDDNEALNIDAKQIGGKPYLFIEAGGFHAKHGQTWRPPWIVMTKR